MVETVAMPDELTPFQNIQNIEQPLRIESDCSPTQNSDISLNLAPMSPPLTVASAVAAEKARLRQQSAMLDKWVSQNGNNLYPTRDEKERLATQMKMTYLQVNRWFANRRRKQTKRVKTVNSPQENVSQPLNETQEVSSEVYSRSKLTLTPEMLDTLKSAFAVHSAQQHNSEQESNESAEILKREQTEVKTEAMVTQDRQAITPPAIEDQAQYATQQMSQLSTGPQYSPELAKLLAHQQVNTPNPLLLAALCTQPYANSGLQQLLPLLQAQTLQQLQMQQLQHQLQYQQMQHPNQQMQQTLIPSSTDATPPTWMSPPVSASPIPVSDESISELSELSPRPSSPPFKDPHQLADPQLTRILNQHTQLTEKEHIAVAVLAGLCMQR